MARDQPGQPGPGGSVEGRLIDLGDGAFSFHETFAPVAWSAGRWPHEDWIEGAFWWVGREADRLVWRRVEATDDYGTVAIGGAADQAIDEAWLRRLCAPMRSAPEGFPDSVVAELRRRRPGAWAFSYGSLFDGLVASIVGQSISLASAGITATRLARLFHRGVHLADRTFFPLPLAEELADADPCFVRQSGVTGKRAEALCAAGRLFAERRVPDAPDDAALAELEPALLALPGIGPWTVASAWLWGIGAADAFPRGDVALLRAARARYGNPTLDMKGLDRLAESWRPFRGEAARLLWLELLGAALGGTT